MSCAPRHPMSFWHRGAARRIVPDKIRKRPGWNDIPAVRNDRIVEIKSALILQPGPAALTDGLERLSRRCGRNDGRTRLHIASTPHHSAMNSAVALVDFRNDSRSTYSLKPCIAAPLAPKHRLGML